VLPFTQALLGTTIGPFAAAVPLSIAAIAFYARLVHGSLCEVDPGVIEAATAAGATPGQIVRWVLLPESLPGLLRGLTVTAISLIGFSAMAGIVGGGGVGDLAIRFGYYRYETRVMVVTVVVLLVLVQIVQVVGDEPLSSPAASVPSRQLPGPLPTPDELGVPILGEDVSEAGPVT
jgi:D-methionine transport system permease protein